MNILLRSLAIFTCVLATTPAMAAPAKVRSGEHEGFSRLVIEGGAQGEWRLRRTSEGYVFRSADPDARYDIARVFDLIPRRRIADLHGDSGGGLELVVSCDCHAMAFATSQKSLVIDVLDGPPDEGSPFERADRSPEGKADDVIAAIQAPPSVNPFAFPAVTPDAHLDLYWNQTERAATLEGAAELPTATEAGKPSGSTPQTRRESHATDTPPPSSDPLQPGNRAEEMHRTLLEQLSRAASQGLVGFDVPQSNPQEQEPHPSHDDAEKSAPAEMPVNKDEDAIPLRIETSIDRDAIFTAPRTELSADGDVCPPDALFAVGDWGDDRPVALQLAAARDGLVGEFDRADQEKVTALAKLYLHIGFGAEARMTLASFSVDGNETRWLGLLARIEDGEPAGEPSLAKLTDCDGTVALWALLGSEGPLSQSDLNDAAIQRSFSELPIHLRRQLGPQIIERLIAAGATTTASGVRNAILRAGGEEELALSVASAALAIEAGDPIAGLGALEAMARGNGPAAEDALVRAIRLRLDRGEAVPPELAANAGALAYEQRYSARGPELAVLQVLALASTGDFTSAFAAEARWDDAFPRELRATTLLRLFARLASDGDEWSLLHHYFTNRARLMESGPDILLRLSLSERLASAGFQAAAAKLLHGEAETTERGRLILARNALAEADPTNALELISTAKGAEAARLRAEALVEVGQPEKAKQQFRAAGDAEGAARAAWLAGSWPEVGDSAPPALTSAVQALRLSETSGQRDQTRSEGELAAGRKLVDEARAARRALDDLVGFATAQ
jgi:hypothetical protein